MPTTVFRADDSHIVWGGNHGFVANAGGRQAWEFQSLNGQIEFIATGTDLTASIFGASDVLTITVDGTPTTINPPAAWTPTTIFAGLSDTTHTVKIKTSVTNGSYFELANALSLTGAAPALSLPTNYSNTLYIAGSQAGVTTDGSAATISTANGNPNTVQGHDVGIRFRATVTRLKVWLFDNNQKFILSIDGVDQNSGVSTSTPNSGKWDWIEVGSGLDGANEHEYTIYVTGTASVFVAEIMAVGGTINTSAITAKPTWAFYGDSIWLGIVTPTNDTAQASPHDITEAQGWGNLNMGINGTCVKGTGNNGESATRVATVPASVTGMVILYGTNDAAQACGAETSVQFGTSYANMLSELRTQIGAGKIIYALGMLNMSGATAAGNRTAFNAAIASAVAATGDPAIIYINTDGWITPGTDTVDGTHPTPAGFTKVTNAFNAAIFVPPVGGGGIAAGFHGFNRSRR